MEIQKIEEVPAEDSKSANSIASEMYWLCQHESNVADFPKRSKRAKRQPKPKKPDEVVIVETPKFPILDSNVPEREIPFRIEQLRAIINFPLSLDDRATINHFDNSKETSIYLPSVSRILSATMPEAQRLALINWKIKKIAELGQEGFDLMQQCKNVKGLSMNFFIMFFLYLAHLRRGKAFHHCVQSHFEGKTVNKSEIDEEIVPMWTSIEPLLGVFTTPATLVEQKIEHPYLKYQGIVDCVGFHNSTPCVMEWKKSDRVKKQLSFTYDAPIQLCSYLGALNASREEFKENPIKSGVIVFAYNDGQKADLFELNETDIKKYWNLWLHRLQDYWVRYRDNTLPEKI